MDSLSISSNRVVTVDAVIRVIEIGKLLSSVLTHDEIEELKLILSPNTKARSNTISSEEELGNMSVS